MHYVTFCLFMLWLAWSSDVLHVSVIYSDIIFFDSFCRSKSRDDHSSRYTWSWSRSGRRDIVHWHKSHRKRNVWRRLPRKTVQEWRDGCHEESVSQWEIQGSQWPRLFVLCFGYFSSLQIKDGWKKTDALNICIEGSLLSDNTNENNDIDARKGKIPARGICYIRRYPHE